ncbi:MAG TPA: four helix bundle protein [Longimicrobium sp.]|nr:four helix bundle protein [Longimicrobium sp.]
MKVSRFEELIAWQKAKALCVQVYRVTGHGQFARDFGLRDQIQRAAVSVMSNIAEGFDRNSRPEFARFLTFARGSAGEVRSQLYLADELGYIRPEEAAALIAACNEITRIIIALRKSLGGSY